MKNTLYLFAVLLFASVILFTGCKKRDDTPGPVTEEAQIAKLSKTWVPESPVQFQGAPDSRFTGFEVTFNANKTYTASNGYPVFRTSGNWTFKPSTNFMTVVLDAGTDFVISSLTDTQLKGSVTLSGGANERTLNIEGKYDFNLKVK